MDHQAEPRPVLTRLGRGVDAMPAALGTVRPKHREEHREANWLRDVILGGQDGLVNILDHSRRDRRRRLENGAAGGGLRRGHYRVDLHGSRRVHLLSGRT